MKTQLPFSGKSSQIVLNVVKTDSVTESSLL